jgi:ubiquinone biosynthesis protein UbiJ
MLAGRVLEIVMNRALALDPEMGARLKALDGHSVQLHLQGLELALTFRIQHGRLEVTPATSDSSLQVTASPGSLLSKLLQRDAAGFAPGKMTMAGDADLARQLVTLITQFAPDLEEAFAQRFGDVLGVPMAQALQRASRHLRRQLHHFGADSAAWLHNEARLTVASGEVDQLLDAIDQLREQTERFEARLARIAHRSKGSAA